MIKKLYTDGGLVISNKQTLAGTWAWCHVDENDKRIGSGCGIVKPFLRDDSGNYKAVTNNNSEMVALTRGLLSLPESWHGKIYCDSRLALGVTFLNFRHPNIPDFLYDRAMEAKKRLGEWKTVLLDGHPTAAQIAAGKGKCGKPVSIHNKFCDELCGITGKVWLANGCELDEGAREQIGAEMEKLERRLS